MNNLAVKNLELLRVAFGHEVRGRVAGRWLAGDLGGCEGLAQATTCPWPVQVSVDEMSCQVEMVRSIQPGYQPTALPCILQNGDCCCCCCWAACQLAACPSWLPGPAASC